MWSRLHKFARTTNEKMSSGWFFVVIFKTTSVHTKCHVTLDTFE